MLDTLFCDVQQAYDCVWLTLFIMLSLRVPIFCRVSSPLSFCPKKFFSISYTGPRCNTHTSHYFETASYYCKNWNTICEWRDAISNLFDILMRCLVATIGLIYPLVKHIWRFHFTFVVVTKLCNIMDWHKQLVKGLLCCCCCCNFIQHKNT